MYAVIMSGRQQTYVGTLILRYVRSDYVRKTTDLRSDSNLEMYAVIMSGRQQTYVGTPILRCTQ